MSKKEKLTTSQVDGVQFKRAKMWQIALSQLTGAGQMCFYTLMSYATYSGYLSGLAGRRHGLCGQLRLCPGQTIPQRYDL